MLPVVFEKFEVIFYYFVSFHYPIIINHFGKRSTVSGEWSENGGYAPDQEVHVYDAIYINYNILL